ncbi:MAG: glutamate--cysteine ligase [Proteobacteria bacterium]|nr:MAG: glutamate--cysteine ligase [Pseudomonadota bacterium]
MTRPLGLFEGFGIEIEYMIVDAERLDVLPVADDVIRAAAGSYVNGVERGDLAWSNELALHVIEMKTNGPAPALGPLPKLFQEGIDDVNRSLEKLGGCLMPTAMHPWMDPFTETRLWPHEYNPIYEAYDRIFDCRGHGWSNLQSMHVNLPFDSEESFTRLHAAIRAALPMLPMLAASSPFADGRAQRSRDYRMQVYRNNARRIPSIAGRIVPEAVSGIADYHERILAPMYADIAPHDPDDILREEWLNSRGAIARFDRDAIEIRVLDTQECPRADIAVAAAVTALVRDLAFERYTGIDDLMALDTDRLARLFLAAVDAGEGAIIDDRAYLGTLGLARFGELRGGQAWSRLIERYPPDDAGLHGPLENILRHGTLATRLLRAAGEDADRARLRALYARLCRCLPDDTLFRAENG